MKMVVPVTRKVEVHAHNFDLRVTLSGGVVHLTLVCLCGNGFNVNPSSTYIHGMWAKGQVNLSTLLEMAAEEQDKRHKDWAP